VSSVSNNKDFEKKDRIIREYLKDVGYPVMEYIGDRQRLTYTYLSDVLGIHFFSKFAIVGEHEKSADKRKRLLKNELEALQSLWEISEDGVYGNFLLPPGPEEIIDDNYKSYDIFGYIRLYLSGEVVGRSFRSGNYDINKWVNVLSGICLDIDSMSDLGLPRTNEKKDQDFAKTIIENTTMWTKKLLNRFDKGEVEGVNEDFIKMVEQAADKVVDYYSSNGVVLGTVHCDLVPDHLLWDPLRKKPYVLNFMRLNQSYPRFFDIAKLYSWILVVLGDGRLAINFWEEATKRFKRKECANVEMLANEMLIGSLWNYIDNEQAVIKFDPEYFWI
jgi:hypothetical protein